MWGGHFSPQAAQAVPAAFTNPSWESPRQKHSSQTLQWAVELEIHTYGICIYIYIIHPCCLLKFLQNQVGERGKGNLMSQQNTEWLQSQTQIFCSYCTTIPSCGAFIYQLAQPQATRHFNLDSSSGGLASEGSWTLAAEGEPRRAAFLASRWEVMECCF